MKGEVRRLGVSDAQTLKTLEDENRRLKRLAAGDGDPLSTQRLSQ